MVNEYDYLKSKGYKVSYPNRLVEAIKTFWLIKFFRWMWK